MSIFGLSTSFGGGVYSEDSSSSDLEMSDKEIMDDDVLSPANAGKNTAQEASSYMRERCKWIPMRLEYEERKSLRLVEAALGVNDYTSVVDDPTMLKKPAKRTHRQIEGIMALLSSMIVAVDYEEGQAVVADRDFKRHERFFRQMLEFARRHKIMNPEKMRSEYGKLIYLLQDSNLEEIQDDLEFSLIQPIKTVYSELEQHGLLRVLDHPLIHVATDVVIDDKTKSRHRLRSEIKRKYQAIDEIGRSFGTRAFGSEEVKQCLYSIGDNNSYLVDSRDVIDKVIDYLKTFFSPDKVEEGYSLAINEGEGTSRLTHSHTRQYHYVLQSLTLWREVTAEMFRLWLLAEMDLLDNEVAYEHQDTGQGQQRVQQSTRTLDAMQAVLKRVQTSLGEWVGSDVIHMGDRNVPNALMFIDKYAQVPRILGPIVKTLEHVDVLEKQPSLKEYIQNRFGDGQELRRLVLCDFFRSAFDGSGADNFFDAGSCIDGRLTSAWNWCSQLDQKPFFPIFKLAGFNGFDGTDGFSNEPRK